ncbi:cache domain-containing sensor histidine kinase [Cohnella hashimotonis]|uniref:histidine kinase n=1 Tax=Cohnella hashimotonis TaxID=2826895 RepID=A0ABT6TGH5_9BACL|nr:sensor histidine kinase [Cohnella hashimotonis]MDI4645854.1 sensor histidine kinase [Cohnella hashimotonis]
MTRMMRLFNRANRYSLANQLVVSFLIIFLFIFTISSLIAYFGILNVLKKNAIDTNQQQFKQNDYNLSVFVNEVDQVSRQLFLEAELQNLINFKSMTEMDSVLQVSAAFQSFTEALSDNKFIDSISYFGDNGFMIRTTAQRNDILFDSTSKVNAFYQERLYSKMKSAGQTLVWFGGFTDQDFNIADTKPMSGIVAKPIHYITAARSFYSNNHSATLVINMDMKYFNDIYNHANDIENNDLYLVDESGRIVSHGDEAKIGQTGAVPEQGYHPAHASDKFASEERNGKQIMSYRISEMDWFLVNEIPVSLFISDILTLRLIVVTMFIFSLASAALLSGYWIRRITKPLNSLTTVVRRMGQGNLGLTLDLDLKNELGILIAQFNKMSKNIQDLIEQKDSIQEEKRTIEIGALQSQINPHFFYNTLNTIKWMAIMVKADNIVESITTLGDYLQPMFKQGMFCTIREEMDYIENYIKIMNYRMAGGVKLHFQIATGVMDYPILRFLLQPLVENAITHGLRNQNGGVITISAAEHKNEIVWSIFDNGEGMSETKLQEIRESLLKSSSEQSSEKKGIGLYNTNRRIQLHFGDRHTIKIQSELQWGTELKFTIPKVQKT